VNASDDDRKSLISIFNNIGDKFKQDTFLGGLIHLKPVIHHRSRNGSRPSKTYSVQYEVKLGTDVILICKKAFCSIFGVGKTAVDRIVKKLQNNIPSPTDNRGKHQNRPNKLPADIHFQINTHINSYPKRQSHYSRLNNSNTRYLSPDLSVAKLYRLFLQKYEPDFWALYNAELSEGREIITMKPTVKYPYFAKYFASNFNISFAYPRSDTCQTCDQLYKSIQNETDPEAKASLDLEKEVHLKKAQIFYTYLKQLTAEAKENNSIDVLSFDFQQNMSLPHISSGDVLYIRQIWSYNFCIHSASTGKSYYFMHNETIAKKGQNEVISFLHYYLKNILSQNIKKVFLFSDNCSAQNKNKLLFQYLSAIVNSQIFSIKSIIHRYTEPGYSFLPCDRCFGHIEKSRRRVETVFLTEEYEKLVSETSSKFNVIHVDQSIILNFTDYLMPLCKKIVTNKEKTKFTIMAYRYVEYNRNEGLFCGRSGNSSISSFKTVQ